jgi:hypothetical protein
MVPTPELQAHSTTTAVPLSIHLSHRAAALRRVEESMLIIQGGKIVPSLLLFDLCCVLYKCGSGLVGCERLCLSGDPHTPTHTHTHRHARAETHTHTHRGVRERMRHTHTDTHTQREGGGGMGWEGRQPTSPACLCVTYDPETQDIRCDAAGEGGGGGRHTISAEAAGVRPLQRVSASSAV